MTHKVLIIDDDPAIHALVGLQLGSLNMEWISAFDGEAGLVMAAKRKPDLILLDVHMPELDGYEVCRRLKSDPATLGIPLLFLSAAASRDEKVVGLDMGAADYIVKPFDSFELRARTMAALRSKRAVDLLASRNLIDEVTGLYNRTYLDRQLHVALAQARRWARPLACILIEVDDFARIGAEFGRPATEAVLQGATASLVQACREEDLLCRYGEAQLAVLAFSTEIENAVELAERLRGDIRARTASHGNAAIRATVSCGVAISHLSWGQTILTEAEEALRHAIQSGGDCVKAAGQVAQLRCG